MENRTGKTRIFRRYRKMNKLASISIVILVLGVFVVCALALASFYSSNFKVKNSFAGIELIEQMNSQIEENSFNGLYSGCAHVEKEVKRLSPEFGFDWIKEKIVFSADYCPP